MRRTSRAARLVTLLITFGMIAAACTTPGGITETTEDSATAVPEPSTEPDPAQSQQEPGEEPSGTTELHIFHFKVNIQTEWQELTDEYSRQNPDVVFINEIIGGGTAWLPILKSKFAAGQGPDIFIVEGPAQAAEFADFLTDLSGEPWTTRAFDWALEGITIDGKLLGMPVNVEGYGYIYNKDIFDEAGVTQKPRTLSELRDAAAKINDAGYTAFSTGYGIWWVNGLHLMNMPFARQDDPQGFMDKALAREVRLAENPLFANLQTLADITLEYGEKDPLTTDKDRQTLAFVNGEVAMIQQGNWREKEILAANPDARIGLVPMPLSDDPVKGDRLAVGVPFYFVVNSQSTPAQQAEARKFLNWLVSSDYGKQALVEKFGFIPAYSDIEPVGLGGVSQDILEYSAAGKVVPWMFGRFPDGAPKEMSDAFQKYVAGISAWDQVLVDLDAIWDRLSG